MRFFPILAHRLPAKSALLLLAVLTACIGKLTIHPEDIRQNGWMTRGGDFRRTSRLISSDLRPPLELAWQDKFAAGVSGQPLVMGNALILPLLNGEIVILNLLDGVKIDRKRFGKGPLRGTTLSGDEIFLTMGKTKKMTAGYDLVHGRFLWKSELGSVESSPVISDDRLFVGSMNGYFYCLWKDSGGIAWKQRGDYGIATSPASHSGMIIYCDGGGVIHALNGEDGIAVWRHNLPGKTYSHPVVSDETVYATTLSGAVLSFDTGDGHVIWKRDLDAPIFAPAAVDSTVLFVPSSSGKIYCLNRSDGSTEWVHDAGTIVNSEIVILNSLVVGVTLKGQIEFLRKSTGKMVWEHTLDRRIIAPPVISGRHLIVADDRKRITVFSSMHGDEVDPGKNR